jgi:hypothetical protein
MAGFYLCHAQVDQQYFSSMDDIELVRGGDDGGRSMKKTGIVFKDF